MNWKMFDSVPEEKKRALTGWSNSSVLESCSFEELCLIPHLILIVLAGRTVNKSMWRQVSETLHWHTDIFNCAGVTIRLCTKPGTMTHMFLHSWWLCLVQSLMVFCFGNLNTVSTLFNKIKSSSWQLISAVNSILKLGNSPWNREP